MWALEQRLLGDRESITTSPIMRVDGEPKQD